ncbi:SDR family NAD(P)-dependent oxidoreductase [Pseudohalocynthiibacter aestuariivivens]|jgi:3-oxoacyl-[acyl-carrier protein] reductase|uniref:SDR family NAD(P)-dependent oxidoreductase n=1 Tax=Pseudohalocynthiibacter aestuariivivens TaxID=1591409 RepID=A0ABV5JFN7_9RHOB|nr:MULTISPECIES: SDR family oxidoreductase [Pseudohalocynthiibacter]MBS9718099.1 SDR family oxidoreductase [Pseudohalocynthiibacter aestuariivivens]MCK0103310.1 SDR family oxidoreductase [Pseudohalocynthiibacter sp. F2068]
MNDFSPRNVLVTGAHQGIGAATAHVLATNGLRVACADIIVPDATVAGLVEHSKGHVSLACDVSDETSVVGMFADLDKKIGSIDAVVHCAGVIAERPLLETSVEEFDRVIAINLRGSFLVGREALRRMEGREGRVVLTSSDLGVSGRETFSPYVASKHGVMGLVRSWAKEFAPRILVNALCPGPIDTDMLGAKNMTPEWRARELDIPLARFGRPDEVAHMAAFLIGPYAGFITGQGIGINGGSAMP